MTAFRINDWNESARTTTLKAVNTPPGGPAMNTLVRPVALPHAAWSDLSARLRVLLANGRRTLATWAERARTRRQLAALDDANLRDLGLCRSAADFEADKPFWQD